MKISRNTYNPKLTIFKLMGIIGVNYSFLKNNKNLFVDWDLMKFNDDRIQSII